MGGFTQRGLSQLGRKLPPAPQPRVPGIWWAQGPGRPPVSEDWLGLSHKHTGTRRPPKITVRLLPQSNSFLSATKPTRSTGDTDARCLSCRGTATRARWRPWGVTGALRPHRKAKTLQSACRPWPPSLRRRSWTRRRGTARKRWNCFFSCRKGLQSADVENHAHLSHVWVSHIGKESRKETKSTNGAFSLPFLSSCSLQLLSFRRLCWIWPWLTRVVNQLWNRHSARSRNRGQYLDKTIGKN